MKHWLKNMRRKRIPVILQLTATECGAACLAMILNYYNSHVSLAECREALDVGRDGVSAYSLKTTAHHFGLRVSALQGNDYDSLKTIDTPAIIFWEHHHFMVVEDWMPNRVRVIDPRMGRQTLTVAEFLDGFSGIIFSITLSPDFKPRKKSRPSSWRRFQRHFINLADNRALLLQIFAVTLLAQVFGLAVPLFNKVFVDYIIAFDVRDWLTLVVYSIGLLGASYLASGMLRGMLVLYLHAKLDHRIMIGFFAHTLKLPFRFFQEVTSGDLLMRLNSNLVIREMLSNHLLSMAVDGVFSLVYLIALWIVSPALGAAALILSIIQLSIFTTTGRYNFRLSKRELAAQSDSQGFLVQALRGITAVKSHGVEEQAITTWRGLFSIQLGLSLRHGILQTITNALLLTLRLLSPLILLTLGSIFVIEGWMSLGTMFAAISIAISFLTPVATLSLVIQNFQQVAAHLERVLDVMDRPSEITSSQTLRPAVGLKGCIELRDVTFGFGDNLRPTLTDISLSIQPGQRVAIVGRTGSGKSTLGLLMLGFYEANAGNILLDNIPLDEYDPVSLRQSFGVVMQVPALIGTTIGEAIRFGRTSLGETEVLRAAFIADIHEDIIKMPMKYNTSIAENGQAISGGQRQRIAIARAVVNHPTVLLLDEATSNLDELTEKQIITNLSQLPSTQIIITHRLSILSKMDCIYVLDDGCLIEQGTHDQLMVKNEFYASLLQSRDTLGDNRIT